MQTCQSSEDTTRKDALNLAQVKKSNSRKDKVIQGCQKIQNERKLDEKKIILTFSIKTVTSYIVVLLGM